MIEVVAAKPKGHNCLVSPWSGEWVMHCSCGYADWWVSWDEAVEARWVHLGVRPV